MFGLNATRQNWMGEEQVKELRAVGNKVADVCADLLSFAAKMYGHSELCDASTVSWLIDPAVVKKSLMVHIDVETKGEFTRGMTVCDWRKYMGEDPKEDLSHEKQVDADGKTWEYRLVPGDKIIVDNTFKYVIGMAIPVVVDGE